MEELMHFIEMKPYISKKIWRLWSTRHCIKPSKCTFLNTLRSRGFRAWGAMWSTSYWIHSYCDAPAMCIGEDFMCVKLSSSMSSSSGDVIIMDMSPDQGHSKVMRECMLMRETDIITGCVAISGKMSTYYSILNILLFT